MRARKMLALTALSALAVAGCSSLSEVARLRPVAAPLCRPPAGLVLVVGAHRNVPAPVLDGHLRCQVSAVVSAGKPVLIVVASGQPQLITPRLMSVRGGTLAQQNSPRAAEDVQRIQALIRAARPDSPGADDLAALAVAADSARSAGIPRAELVLIDSGLDDRGALDFTVPGMVAATPSEVARQLRTSGNLPDLRGFMVTLVGLGYTAAPQPPLPDKWRRNVTAIWASVMRSAGAAVQIVPQPAQDGPVQTSRPVRLVPVPSDQPARPRIHHLIVFTGASPVSFQPNTTAFADPAAAQRALRPIGRWLASSSSHHVWLVGTTADVGPMAGQVRLSALRAGRVRAALIAMGAGATQMSSKGVGSHFPGFTPDRNAAGVLLAGPATLNRSVRITLGTRRTRET
jgi:outer membrane protein OmpA-like peptidoglycan-associated protein